MFFLVVPDDTLDEAREVTLVGFTEGADGSICFDQEVIPPL